MLDFNVVKLDNIFKGSNLTINSSPHGINQSGKAMDFILDSSNVGEVVAPWDGRVTYIHRQGKLSYFHFTLPDGSFIQFVHGLPHRTGEFKKGEPLGYTTWHHWHVAINIVNLGWRRLLDYTRRDLNLVRGVVNGEIVSAKWANWDTYPDSHLTFHNDYMRQQKLNEAIEWNNDIATKNYVHDYVEVEPMPNAKKGSKIMNEVEGYDRENLLMMYKELVDYVQSSSLKNTPGFDLMNARFAEYTKASSAV